MATKCSVNNTEKSLQTSTQCAHTKHHLFNDKMIHTNSCLYLFKKIYPGIYIIIVKHYVN